MKKKTTYPGIEGLKPEDIKNIEICVSNLKFLVDVNPDMYSETEHNEIWDIVDHMSKEIWIDKTYVVFKGSIWKDAYIDEKRWYELIEMIKPQLFGKKITQKNKDTITIAILAIVINYMYNILEKYGYSIDDIDICVSKGSDMRVAYYNDTRTTWES